jgi:hypothetical protein
MALVPMTSKEQDLTVKAVLSACKDINKLNKRAYKFLYLSNGFIAHYDINGFKSFYSDSNSLKQDIVNNRSFNQWNNFRVGEKDYEYMMAKKSVYNRIVESL